MKQLKCIILLLLLSVGLIAVSHEEQPNSQVSEDLTGNAIGYAISSCSLTASSEEPSSIPSNRSYSTDDGSSSWNRNALCPNSVYTNNNASSKFLKFKLHLPAGQLQRFNYSQLLAEQNYILSFNPNAIRYLHGYYVYALAHILI